MSIEISRSKFNALVLNAIEEGTDILGEVPIKQAFFIISRSALRLNEKGSRTTFRLSTEHSSICLTKAQ
jgi:hypothetical protein